VHGTQLARAGACSRRLFPDNLAGRVTLASGDVRAALEDDAQAASLTLRSGAPAATPMEKSGLVAEYNAMAGAHVWASSQVPHQVRQFICDLLGLEQHACACCAPTFGGGSAAKHDRDDPETC